MSFNEVLAELPSLTAEQRQLLMRRALELDDFPLSPADERLVQARSAEYHANPSQAGVRLEEMEKRLRAARGS
jgi:hypothetical protein